MCCGPRQHRHKFNFFLQVEVSISDTRLEQSNCRGGRWEERGKLGQYRVVYWSVYVWCWQMNLQGGHEGSVTGGMWPDVGHCRCRG